MKGSDEDLLSVVSRSLGPQAELLDGPIVRSECNENPQAGINRTSCDDDAQWPPQWNISGRNWRVAVSKAT
jgi:hypothetical protein